MVTLATSASASAAYAAPSTNFQTIAYSGSGFTAPAQWPVIDLRTSPAACVRFDVHAVYLGSPSSDQSCPSHAQGRTEAVLVEPRDATPAATHLTENPAAHEVVMATPQFKVTATYDTDPTAVRAILESIKGSRWTEPLASTSVPASPTAQRQRTAAPTTSGVQPTSYTGLGFDTCAAPSTAKMTAWLSSPYRAVGIYIGGAARACAQPNLTAGWVAQQAASGWSFMPLYVGIQATRISSPKAEGSAAATDAVAQAAALGLPQGSVLYYDMEAYTTDPLPVIVYLDAWTTRLHELGYRSGVYSSSKSGISDLVRYSADHAIPDVVFDAWWNGVADTTDPNIPSNLWADHQRIHQYRGGHHETYGDTTINIDQDYLDVRAAQ